MAIEQITIGGREVRLHKAFVSPGFGLATVLTNSPWSFVGQWLKKEGQKEALFYWEQAQRFYSAAEGLPVEASPLLIYYSFMNAAKALLTAKGITFSPYHGVGELKLTTQRAKITFANEQVSIKDKGIVPSLIAYFGETKSPNSHSLKSLLFNIACIHRTYALTFVSQKEMFVPIKNSNFLFDTKKKELFFQGEISKHWSKREIEGKLPATLQLFQEGKDLFIKSAQSIPWKSKRGASEKQLKRLADFQYTLRFDLQYIGGSEALWYIKLLSKHDRIRRAPPTIMLMAAHRLSELCRYKPGSLSSYLDSKQSWLLSEFVAMTPPQYLDEIASEITGYQFMIPNVRTAT